MLKMAEVIAITGPESTGKTVLASGLATHYNSIWVPEFAREYLTGFERKYSLDDVVFIAEQQELAIKKAQEKPLEFIFADTEILVCYVWALFVFGEVPAAILDRLKNQHFSLYLLCYPDLPWEPDPLREHPDQGLELFRIYEKILGEMNWNYRVISGLEHNRLKNAFSEIDRLINQK